MENIICVGSLGLMSSTINNCMILLFRTKMLPLRVEEEVGLLLLSHMDIVRIKGVCNSVLFIVLKQWKHFYFVLVCDDRILDIG